MSNRLAIEAPELDRVVSVAPPDASRTAAMETVSALSLQFPEVLRELTAALRDRDGEAAASLALRLDDHYLDLEERGEEGFEREFCCARIAMAAEFAIKGSVHEALYECIIATGDAPRVTALFSEALRGEG